MERNLRFRIHDSLPDNEDCTGLPLPVNCTGSGNISEALAATFSNRQVVRVLLTYDDGSGMEVWEENESQNRIKDLEARKIYDQGPCHLYPHGRCSICDRYEEAAIWLDGVNDPE